MRTKLMVLLALIGASILLMNVGGAGALVGSRTYTLDVDFDEGLLVNVNHDAPNNDQLQLNETTTPFPFVNIAASALGTIVRIDVNTGTVLGEYNTAPDGMGKDPSRTTVDQLGNVWVANRGEGGESPPGSGTPRGSIARVGLIIGGTWADANGTPNPAGQYLKPPFQYTTCVDRHGATIADPPDGLIKTSTGLGNVLAWTNAAGADTHGGVSTADDECIINYTRVTGTGTRTVAIDANNDVWVGGLLNSEHEKVDGVTGLPVPGTQFNLGCGGYGGLIDGNGVLWSAGQTWTPLLRYDTNTNTGQCLTGRGNYGLGIDLNTGHIWHSTISVSPLNVYELDSNGAVLNSYPQPFGSAQGVAVDGNSHVWVAGLFGSQVAHYAPDLANPGQHILVGTVSGFAGTTGVAVDANGKIWAAEQGDRASRIDPSAGLIGGGGYNVGAIDMTVSLRPGSSPYNYSDMTGFVAIGATAPQGFWTVIFDSEGPGTEWGKVSWNTENLQNCPATAGEREPPGTSITARARSAETEAGLGGATYINAPNGVDINPPDGRYIQVEVKLTPNEAGDSPIVCDVTIETAEVPPPTPTVAGRMTGGGSVFQGSRVTHGFELHCDASEEPNNLEVNWDGNSFHLESLDSARCSDDPAIEPNPPTADFDTYEGAGTGRYNGVSGATAEWTFTDAGEPGGGDTAQISIKDVGGNVVLSVSGNLNKGNHQAHRGHAPPATPTPTVAATAAPSPTPTPTLTPLPTPMRTPTPAPSPTPTPTPTFTPTRTATATPTSTQTPPPTSTPATPTTATPTPTSTPVPCPPGANCIAADADGGGAGAPGVQASRTVPDSNPFDIDIAVTGAGVPYVAYQEKLQYDPTVLDYDAHAFLTPPPLVLCGSLVVDEVGGTVFAGCGAMSATTYEGPVETITFHCLVQDGSVSPLHLMSVVEDPVFGTTTASGPGVIITTLLTDASVTCLAPALLADGDGDGCTDQQELGPDAALGGQRDPLNPYDFYDVPVPTAFNVGALDDRDQAVSIINDVLAVLEYTGTSDGGPPNGLGRQYNQDRNGDTLDDGLLYDRSVGPRWSAAPDGAVSIIQDVLLVLAQSGHSCQAPPP